ncbi:MAG: helix-turn-helix domain-containing protein [Sulfurifustis sp.]
MIVYVSVPALIALILKLALIGYSVRSAQRTTIARLFLALLIVLALVDVDEIFFLNYVARHGVTGPVQVSGLVYMALGILTTSILLHLSLALSLDRTRFLHGAGKFLLYAPALTLICLLLVTDRMVRDFTPFSFSILRQPGPWFFGIEAYWVSCLSLVLAILAYGARASRPALLRIRNRLWLLALAPVVFLAIYLVIANHFSWTQLTFPLYTPIAITFFLIVTTYATHERPRPGSSYRFLYRLFDLDAYVPWSQVHKRKAEFHRRADAMLAELGALHSIRDTVKRISDVFQCPVVWVGGGHTPVVAGDTPELARFPRSELAKVDQLLLTHQAARTHPTIHALMTNHKVGAIVPFYPYSRAASWMLLGESFNEQVYTPLDYERVKPLFDRIANHLLDEQMLLSNLLTEERRKLRALRRRLENVGWQLETTENRLQLISEENRRLREQAVSDSGASLTHRPASPDRPQDGGKTLDEHVSQFEAQMIADALAQCDGNQARAAALLGLRRNTLHYKIKRYGLAGTPPKGE